MMCLNPIASVSGYARMGSSVLPVRRDSNCDNAESAVSSRFLLVDLLC